MKQYVNKTRFLRRVVFYTDKKSGATTTVFLGAGQVCNSKDEAQFVDTGVKVSEASSPVKATKKDQKNTDEGKE